MTISEGTRLGRYQIRLKIGAGGMGEASLAQNTELDRTSHRNRVVNSRDTVLPTLPNSSEEGNE